VKLAEYGELIAYELAFFGQSLTNPACPIHEAGDLSLALSARFRGLGIMALLVKGDHTLLCHNLIRSGRVRLAYLRRVRAEGKLNEHHFVSGRYGALVDAIAAGDFHLAREIADLAPEEWRKEREYEDDYCYARILGALLDAGAEPQMNQLFTQFEAYLGGDENPRLDVTRALAMRDTLRFENAFDDLLHDRERQIDSDEERGQLETPEVIAERQVFVEGLALLRLAGLRGVETQLEYLYCPSVARLQMTEPFPGE
jgi:hypothetical protein